MFTRVIGIVKKKLPLTRFTVSRGVSGWGARGPEPVWTTFEREWLEMGEREIRTEAGGALGLLQHRRGLSWRGDSQWGWKRRRCRRRG